MKWKEIPGVDKSYQISDSGIFRSNKYQRGWRILRLQPVKNGYLHAMVSEGPRVRRMLVHRLVAMAFLPNPKNKPNVNHKDFNKKNNRVENLEWMTQVENRRHALNAGRVTFRRGGDHHWSKFTDAQCAEMRRLVINGESTTAVAKKFGASRTHVSIVSRGYRTTKDVAYSSNELRP